MLGNIGFPEMIMILAVVLLVFGAKRLPEIGSSFGKGIREFKRSLSDATDAINAPDNQAPPSRQIDQRDATSAPTAGGEPKRLSQ
ncbi:MAG: twin-arginine translocase TatA/TatE family subunit [Gemmatimonadales bacterium]|jgi:sec-independent protein translocase protein TatA|nr:MAG: twin-arginine translocase TatA/TatE family subunit [Gemmatimonadales bacterium]